MTAGTVVETLRALVASGELDLPPIGAGRTAQRWQALREIARSNVSVARLAEAHADGVQILREAERRHPAGRVLGVWASEHPRHTLTATAQPIPASPHDQRFVLHGSKAFCTGAGIVDDALVTASTANGPVLFVVARERIGTRRIDVSEWKASALADTCTAIVDFEGIEVTADDAVGGPTWYLERPGFWHGAIGPAACWAGAALGLVDHAVAHAPTDPHGRAHLGAMVARQWLLTSVLDGAGREADRSPADRDAAQRRALVVRHLVDDACADIQDRFGRALGPRPFVNHTAIAERNEALTIYRRQCHAERDLEALGSLPPAGPKRL